MSKKQLQDAVQSAKKNMDKAAKSMDFLEAAKYRDEMYALEKMMEEKFTP
jgi:excinuclease ABC subunit B